MQLDILFLDIDGVLNPYGTRHPHVFAPECVAHLKRLFAACPELKVVFSTAWRLDTSFFVLGWLWRQHDLPLRAVIGRTADVDPSQRGVEVRKWLTDSPTMFAGCRIRRYAALDDEPEPILEQLPPDSVFRCNPSTGLSGKTTDQLIRYFSE
jgi:hypothetical protein